MSMKYSKFLKENLLLLFIFFLSLLINIGSVFYYLYKLNNIVALVSVFLSLTLLILFFYFSINRGHHQAEKFKNTRARWFLSFFSFAFFVLFFLILIRSANFSAISSPWSILGQIFFFLAGFLVLLMFLNIKLRNNLNPLFLILFYFSFFSVSFFVYRIAFGYDQLLHQRAFSDILTWGFIEPKTFYYIGQYSLEFFLSKLWPFSLEDLNRFLVPALSALLLPLSFIYNFKHRSLWPLLILLILPFSIFTYTLPQNLAFLFFLVLLIFSLNKNFLEKKVNFFFLFSLALSIFFIHPLAGVPALIFFSLLFIAKFLNYRGLRFLSYLAQIVSLPVLLLISGGVFSAFRFDISRWHFKFLGQEDVILNFVYFFSFNVNYFLLLLLLLSLVFILWKKRKFLRIYLYNSLALLISYFLTLFIDFPFLSAIDKDSYSQRILIMAGLFLVPIFYEMFVYLVDRIKKEKLIFRLVSLFLLFSLLLTSLYLSYPRKDDYFNSRSYSSSLSDFEVVRLIDSFSKTGNYIVLANQQLGAVAIKEFGFNRYYGPWFYYSVQTGGLLYDRYLKIVEEPNKGLVYSLLDEIGAEECFVVVHDYWWGFDRIKEEMYIEADDYFFVGDENVYIFYFEK
jgi:hypothetical protein